jgi:hypothetical protein
MKHLSAFPETAKHTELYINNIYVYERSWGSSVGIATGYGLDVWCSIPCRDMRDSVIHSD